MLVYDAEPTVNQHWLITTPSDSVLGMFVLLLSLVWNDTTVSHTSLRSYRRSHALRPENRKMGKARHFKTFPQATYISKNQLLTRPLFENAF